MEGLAAHHALHVRLRNDSMKTNLALLAVFTIAAHFFSALGADAPLGKVVTINTEWNFVLVNVGEKDGVKAGMNLIVETSDGKQHACKIIEVESDQTVIEFAAESIGSLKVNDPVVEQRQPAPVAEQGVGLKGLQP
jgi:hypothetical protein